MFLHLFACQSGRLVSGHVIRQVGEQAIRRVYMARLGCRSEQQACRLAGRQRTGRNVGRREGCCLTCGGTNSLESGRIDELMRQPETRRWHMMGGRAGERVDKLTGSQMYGRLNISMRWQCGCTYGRANGRMDWRVGGRINGWNGVQTDGRTYGLFCWRANRRTSWMESSWTDE